MKQGEERCKGAGARERSLSSEYPRKKHGIALSRLNLFVSNVSLCRSSILLHASCSEMSFRR